MFCLFLLLLFCQNADKATENAKFCFSKVKVESTMISSSLEVAKLFSRALSKKRKKKAIIVIRTDTPIKSALEED